MSWVVAAGMATGFFQVVEPAGIWWLRAPDGSRFLSKGICTTRYALDYNPLTRISTDGEAARAKYGSEEVWRAAVAPRLMPWGCNTLGAWSDEKLAEIAVEGRHLALAPTLDLGAQFVAHKLPGRQAWLHGIFPDLFDPEFAPFVRERARQQCAAAESLHAV